MSGKVIDLVGLKVGDFTVLDRHHTHESGHIYWSCRCECGEVKLVRGVRLRLGSSIRCLVCKPAQENKYKQKIKSNFDYRLKNIFYGMRARCNNKNHAYYDLYGGNGIKICEEWGEFKVFRKWALAQGYGHQLTLDRIENAGNYSPDNCRWVNTVDQAKNKDSAIRMPNGEYAKDYAEKHGVPYWTFYRRYRYLKWDIETSATYPTKMHKKSHKKGSAFPSKVTTSNVTTDKVEDTNEWASLLANIGYV